MTASRLCRPRKPAVLLAWAILLATAGTPAFGAHSEAVHGASGMVASSSMAASRAGLGMLRRGGNAIDAAVATGFALAVTYPSAGNLAGGGFMVIHLADGTVVTNDHRETAPAGASRDMFLDADGNAVPERSRFSHLAVGVPGTVAGLLDVLERHGRLKRDEVIAPAIRMAREGFPLTFHLAREFNRRKEQFCRHAPTCAKFSRKDGKAWAEGDIWVQPELAAALERISRSGRDGFYAGRTAELLVAEMERHGGLVGKADLAGYRSVWRQPVKGTYRGYTVWGMPPPSSGGVLLVQMLNMLESRDLTATGWGSAATMHAMIEAERRAYADRAEYLGDPDFVDVPVARLTGKAYARQRFADFDPARASRSADIGAGSWPAESPDTTHVSVMDRAGNAVAYTTTLNLSFGARFIAAGTGMLLNNEMDDFSAKPDTPNAYGLLGRTANEVQPGKRMLSSMTPTIVSEGGRAVVVTGSPGGSTIITTTLQVVLNVIDHRMTLADAVGSPRFHHQWQPDRVLYEKVGFSPDTLRLLESMGHGNLVEVPWGRGIGDANSVRFRDGGLLGVSDPRGDGGAAGF